MSRASNSLKATDVTATPIKLKYSASYSNTSICDTGIYAKSGINGPVTVTGSIPAATLRYRSIRQLYYANYLTGSYLTTSSSFDNFLQSTAASGTFEGNTAVSASTDVRYFPTESGAKIKIISIPQSSLGQQTSRKSFFLTGSNGTVFTLVDDGNGNVIDTLSNNVHVGNIIYPQGFVIITNPNYYCAMDGGPTTTAKYYMFDISQSVKSFAPISGAIPDCAPIVSSSLALSSYPYYNFPSTSIASDGVVTLSEADPLTNEVGIYKDYYTVKSTYCAVSDEQPITVQIVDCNIAGLVATNLLCTVNGLSLTLVPATATPTPLPATATPLPATATPTPSPTPTFPIPTGVPTNTPASTATPIPTRTPSPTTTPTPTPTSGPTATPIPSASLAWSYTKFSSTGTMVININGVPTITNGSTGTGTYPVYTGDTISVTINAGGCSGGNNIANAYADTGIISDGSCSATYTIFTSYIYNVVAGDIGTVLSLNGYSSCDGGCH